MELWFQSMFHPNSTHYCLIGTREPTICLLINIDVYNVKMKLFLKIIDIYKQNINLIKRHLVISLLCGLIELCLFLLMFKFVLTTLFASHFVSSCCATLVGFVGHSYYTFEIGYLHKVNLIYFIVQVTLALFLGYLILNFFINTLFLSPSLSKIIQLCLVFNFNFYFGKTISYKKR